MIHRILEFGFAAAIVIAVCGFGGTEPISWAIAQTLIFFLGILVLATSPAKSLKQRVKLLWLPAALCSWIAVQWCASRDGKIGLDAHAIAAHGLALATSIVAFFIALEIARRRESRERFVLCLIGLGVFESLLGLAEYLAGWPYFWNISHRPGIGTATGSYINHNHYAGLLEMILPLSLGLAFYHWQKIRRPSSRRSFAAVLANFNDTEIRKCFLLLLAAILMLVAIVFSLSRMGMISALVSLVVMSVTLWTARRRSRAPAALIVLLLASGVAATAWLGIGPVVEHFEQLPRNEPLADGGEGRMALWKNAAILIRERPLTGFGLGCFEYAFTRVQSVRLTYIADYAHNDYLQLAAELGVPCTLILFAVLFWLAARMLQASLRASSSLTRSLALGSLGGISALLVHSAADFNLYIPSRRTLSYSPLSSEWDSPCRSKSTRATGRNPLAPLQSPI